MTSRTHSWLASRRVELSPYDPAWPRRFDELARAIRDALGPVACRVEHVGSTAVPGLSAKPTIDVQLSVETLDPWERYGVPLERLGYAYREDDDVPDQHRFLGLTEDERRLVNLHVCLTGSWWERRHIAVRDELRRNPELREEYERRKRRLAAEFPGDVHAYAAAKTPVVLRIQRAAMGIPDPEFHAADPVVVTAYDPSWPDRFREEAAVLGGALGRSFLTVEHVGSTAVPGLAARPVIDIALSVRRLEPPDAYLPALEEVGYEPGPDHGPGQSLRKGGLRRVHLHLFEEGQGDERRQMAFRDYLRARPDQARRYGLLKLLLAEDLRGDAAAYVEAKEPYIWVIEQRMKEEGFGVD